MSKITYDNKVTLNEQPSIANINKVTSGDMNEIKTVVNANDDNLGTLSNLNTTVKTDLVSAINEVNSKIPDVYSTSEIKTNKVWTDGKPIYRITLSKNVNASTSAVVGTDFSIDSTAETKMVDYSKSFYKNTGSNNTRFYFIDRYVSSTEYIKPYWRDRTDNVFAIDIRGYTAGSITVTFEYTKSTD